MYNLTKKDAVWKWTVEEITVFNDLKKAIKQAAVLEFPEPGVPMLHSVDASKYGLGALLYKVKNGKRIPMAFLSKSLTDSETRYTNTEREGLAVPWAINLLDSYLWRNEFTVESDHSPLLLLRKKGELSGRWTRWNHTLAEYDFTMVHKERKSMCHWTPDLLSRSQNPPPKTRSIEISTDDGPLDYDYKELEEIYLITTIPLLHGLRPEMEKMQEDAKISPLYRYVKTGVVDPTVTAILSSTMQSLSL